MQREVFLGCIELTGLPVPPTSCLVNVRCTKEDARVTMNEALATTCWGTTDGTDRERLGDGLCHGQQGWHRVKRTAAEVEVESSDNDPDTILGEGLSDGHEAVIKKLCFVDTHDDGIPYTIENLSGVLDGHTRNAHIVVGHHLGLGIPRVDRWLKHKHFLACNPSTVDAAEQLFGLAGEHASRDHFDPTRASRVEMRCHTFVYHSLCRRVERDS